MTILYVKTDAPAAEISIRDKGAILANHTWQAHRKLADTLHREIVSILETANKSLEDIDGIVFYRGPGSFTGLRISAAAVNAIAYSYNIPVVGTNGKSWIKKGTEVIRAGKADKQVTLEYGRPAHTTQQKK